MPKTDAYVLAKKVRRAWNILRGGEAWERGGEDTGAETGEFAFAFEVGFAFVDSRFAIVVRVVWDLDMD